jgi:hypothetical protein
MLERRLGGVRLQTLAMRSPAANPKGGKLMKATHKSELKNVRQRVGTLVLKPLKQVAELVLRTIVASFVFYVGVAVALHLMGYPVPRISDLSGYLERLTELSKILS